MGLGEKKDGCGKEYTASWLLSFIFHYHL